MPEGPEVKYLVDYLNKQLKNNKITDIIIHGGRYKRHKNLYNENLKIIFPLKINKIECHGKFIYWDLEKYILFNTLGMSGWWIYEKEKHSNIEFKLSKCSIYFNDYRNFGTLKFCTRDNLDKKLKELGPDILTLKDEKENFKKRLDKKRNDTTIGAAIMDQKVAAGCGNYIRSECLYIAKVSPFRKVKDLSEEEIFRIWEILNQLGWFYYDEKKGIKLGIINNKYKLNSKMKKHGPSKYKREQGYFLVYQQNVDPLGNKVYTEKINSRTVHYVKELQR